LDSRQLGTNLIPRQLGTNLDSRQLGTNLILENETQSFRSPLI
ncbi:MAG: hypothetical protein JWM11_6899, partial [Planctomycetaceae bacterium]|nr:hypothetical protein [Planctomycetaceae bacterium]